MARKEPPGLRHVAVVTVLYNSADVIADCIASIPGEVEVITVDNASTDDCVARAQAVRSDMIVIRSDRNLGFGAGCNLGWWATRRPYIAFINPDVRLRFETLEILLRRVVSEPYSVVGPVLLDASGTAQRCKRSPTPLLDFCGLLPSASHWAPAGWDGRIESDKVLMAGGTVACVEGACFIVARSDLEAIGGFDEDFFLYDEEESLALRLASRGGKAIYESRAVAEHIGAASTRKVGGFAIRHIHRSRVIFYRKRDGNLRGVLTALLLVLGAALSVPSSAANMMLGRHGHVTPLHQCHALCGLVAGMTARLRSNVSYPAASQSRNRRCPRDASRSD